MFSHNGPNTDTGFESMTTTPPQPFYGPFPGPSGSAGARRELLDFTVQGEINRGRHTDHAAGYHSIWTNQCPPPPHTPPYILQARCPSYRPTNSVKALKATSAIALWEKMLEFSSVVLPAPSPYLTISVP